MKLTIKNNKLIFENDDRILFKNNKVCLKEFNKHHNSKGWEPAKRNNVGDAIVNDAEYASPSSEWNKTFNLTDFIAGKKMDKQDDFKEKFERSEDAMSFNNGYIDPVTSVLLHYYVEKKSVFFEKTINLINLTRAATSKGLELMNHSNISKIYSVDEVGLLSYLKTKGDAYIEAVDEVKKDVFGPFDELNKVNYVPIEIINFMKTFDLEKYIETYEPILKADECFFLQDSTILYNFKSKKSSSINTSIYSGGQYHKIITNEYMGNAVLELLNGFKQLYDFYDHFNTHIRSKLNKPQGQLFTDILWAHKVNFSDTNVKILFDILVDENGKTNSNINFYDVMIILDVCCNAGKNKMQTNSDKQYNPFNNPEGNYLNLFNTIIAPYEKNNKSLIEDHSIILDEMNKLYTKSDQKWKVDFINRYNFLIILLLSIEIIVKNSDSVENIVRELGGGEKITEGLCRKILNLVLSKHNDYIKSNSRVMVNDLSSTRELIESGDILFTDAMHRLFLPSWRNILGILNISTHEQVPKEINAWDLSSEVNKKDTSVLKVDDSQSAMIKMISAVFYDNITLINNTLMKELRRVIIPNNPTAAINNNKVTLNNKVLMEWSANQGNNITVENNGSKVIYVPLTITVKTTKIFIGMKNGERDQVTAHSWFYTFAKTCFKIFKHLRSRMDATFDEAQINQIGLMLDELSKESTGIWNTKTITFGGVDKNSEGILAGIALINKSNESSVDITIHAGRYHSSNLHDPKDVYNIILNHIKKIKGN